MNVTTYLTSDPMVAPVASRTVRSTKPVADVLGNLGAAGWQYVADDHRTGERVYAHPDVLTMLGLVLGAGEEWPPV